MQVGDTVRHNGFTGTIVQQLGSWSWVLWDDKTEHYSGGPEGPAGTRKVTAPEHWPTDYLEPVEVKA